MARKRVRSSLVYSPQWDGGISGWAANFIRNNRWRCDSIHDFDDLMNDAYLCFIKVCQYYPRIMEPRHFMALFKTALRNSMHDKARYMKHKRLMHEETPEDVSDLYAGRIGELTNQGYLLTLLNGAPQEIRAGLRVIDSDAEAVRINSVTGKRENLNARIGRVLGSGRDFDFSGHLRQLLEA